MIRLTFALAIFLTIGPDPASAQTTDPSVGRLNWAGFKKRIHCTTALVDRSAALTAKHCVDQLPIDQLRVVLGYARGAWKELLTVKKIVVLPEQDIAVLCLNKASQQKPIKVQPKLLKFKAQSATVVGYPRSRPHVQQRKTCRLLTGYPQARFMCKVEPGMSGAPTIITVDNEPNLVGIVSKSGIVSSIIERIHLLKLDGC